jgi:N-methylhydantoinase A
MAHYALALDIGGTFTDVMLMHQASRQLWTVKTPSTPAEPAQGFFQGIQKMLHLAGLTP